MSISRYNTYLNYPYQICSERFLFPARALQTDDFWLPHHLIQKLRRWFNLHILSDQQVCTFPVCLLISYPTFLETVTPYWSSISTLESVHFTNMYELLHSGSSTSSSSDFPVWPQEWQLRISTHWDEVRSIKGLLGNNTGKRKKDKKGSKRDWAEGTVGPQRCPVTSSRAMTASERSLVSTQTPRPSDHGLACLVARDCWKGAHNW